MAVAKPDDCFFINIMDLFDKQISLTSFEEGSLVSRNGIFEEPFLDTETGVAKSKKVYKNGLIPCEVTRKTTLSPTATSAFLTERPKHVPEYKWKHMSGKRRIKEHLYRIVGHYGFTFELL